MDQVRPRDEVQTPVGPLVHPPGNEADRIIAYRLALPTAGRKGWARKVPKLSVALSHLNGPRAVSDVPGAAVIYSLLLVGPPPPVERTIRAGRPRGWPNRKARRCHTQGKATMSRRMVSTAKLRSAADVGRSGVWNLSPSAKAW
jgi:hypothetical protein